MELGTLFGRRTPTPPPPDPAVRDEALARLFAIGDRLLAARRDAIVATRAFQEARRVALQAVTEHRDAVRSTGRPVEEGAAGWLVPSWPAVTAGEAFLNRSANSDTVFAAAIRDQERAERNWLIEKGRYAPGGE